MDYIKKSFMFGVVHSMQGDGNFYQHMPPELKNKLVFTLLLGYYKKFFFFFNDVIE